MMTIFKKISAIVLGIAVSGVLILPLGARGDVTSAVGYLKSKSTTAWSIMALKAAGESVDASSLQSANGSTAVEIEAPIMAIVAAGHNPRTYATTDLIAKLKTFYTGGQIGDATTLNDDIFGILALSAAGESGASPEITGTKQFILAHQNTDGGWPFVVGGTSDTNTTAMAASALLEAGVSSSNTAITNAVTYLKNAQNTDGGFPYDPQSSYGTASDASSDAWVISFVNKLGQDPHTWTKSGANPVDHLLSLQAQQGYVRFQPGSSEDAFSGVTTAYAVIALSNASYPVAHLQVPAGVAVQYRIEGSSAMVCKGNAIATNALVLVQTAAEQCGFTYDIQQLSFGPYLSRINNDQASGVLGWLYLVNNQSPSVGAGDYTLTAGDTVVWYFGDFTWPLTRLTLPAEHVSSSAAVVATVESYANGAWQPLPGASVRAGADTFITDSAGNATLILSDGSFDVAATKSGYVRTNTERLIIGELSTQGVDLSLTVTGGSVTPPNGQTISFILSTSSIGFGNLAVGTTGSKSVTISNTGQVPAVFEATVAGDPIFTDNLKLDGGIWRNFVTTLSSGGGKAIPLTIKIPAGATSGSKSGNLVFWASAAH